MRLTLLGVPFLVLACLLRTSAVRSAAAPANPDAGVESAAQSGQPNQGSAPAVPPERSPSQQAVTILAGGDVTLGYHFQEYFDEQVGLGRSPEEMIEYPFREVRSTAADADLFVINLECPFTSRGEKIPKNFNFRARPDLVRGLIAGGVGAVSLANNHLMDYGPLGLLDTLSTLDAAHLPHFGAGKNLAEARRPALIERRGVRIALLGYFFLGQHNIEPQEVIATEHRPGVAGHWADAEIMERMLREDVAAAKLQADLVIPFFHWGREGNHFPEPYQTKLAHAAIDSGAAAVLGSHPHVLQGLELYRGAPVVYSLGNFVFGGNWDPKNKESALIKAKFSSAGYLTSEVIPVQIDRYPEFPIQPVLLSGERAGLVLRHLREYSRGFEQPLPEIARY